MVQTMETALWRASPRQEMEPFCFLCGSPRVGGPYVEVQGWKYVMCDDCEGVFLLPLPDEQALTTYYNQIYMVPAEAYARGTRKNSTAVLKLLGRKSPAKGKLLEVGSSYGFFLQEARRDGWDVTGIELDQAAARYGQEKLGLSVIPGSLENAIHQLEPPYEAIVSFHVIEHLRDPMSFLATCRTLLGRNGVLILKTPNVASWIARRAGANWQWLSPPAHVHLFSPRSLASALEKQGFDVDEIVSRRGDAHNNLFELFCAMGRRAALGGRLRRQKRGNTRRTWGDRWEVNAARALCELVYFPAGLLVDPWLERKGLQPELLAVAQAQGNESGNG